MNLKKHYFMTVTALFFLGLIVAKPGASFYPHEENRECSWVKGKKECEYKSQEYLLNDQVIQYRFNK